ncbi:MucR family transcriptional regulator [Flavisphingomonas formosensis]|uniref:MucR family transcriptional regulator n=1 Tax=Flavisphingomonas formosensis TaxID=861534 RepID=UPI0012F93C08|nr:MucR family transcriptional regulator [Sphingomonas formosensis]
MAEDNDLIAMTIEVVASYVSHNELPPEEVAGFIAKTHAAIIAIDKEPDAAVTQADVASRPAVSVRKSLASREHILSLIDGKPYKSLKRHLKVHGLTPAQYREKFGLKPDYPMVSPAYSDARRAVAKRLGLGGRPRRSSGEARTDAPAASATRARKKLSIVT